MSDPVDPSVSSSLSHVAADLYMRQRPDSGFTAISRLTGTPIEELYAQWTSRPMLLRAYYADAFQRYSELEATVPDFKQYKLSEKLATLIFSLSDEMEFVPGFAAETFRSLATDNLRSTDFERLVRDRIRWYIDSDPQVSSLAQPIINKTSATVLTKLVMALLYEHLRDQSEDKAYSSALIDKACTFIESIYYSGIADKAIDLIKYLTINYRSK
jgi:hypothetical protein